MEKYGDGFARAGNLVSNGAYMLVEQVPQSHVTVARNPYFHGAAGVAYDRVRFHATEDTQAELRRFRAGELDITETVPPSQIDWVRENLPAEFRLAPRAGINFIAPNLRREPWKSNRALRLALSLTIDREGIARRILRDGEPAFTFVPPGLPDYAPALPAQAAWTQDARDALARDLYAQAGYSPDRPLTLTLLYATKEANKQMAVAIAARWQSVLGVKTLLENQESKVVLGRMRDGSYPDLMLREWFWVFPEKYLEIMRSREQRNGNGYQNPDFDAAMAVADSAASRSDFAQALQRAEGLLLSDAALMPVTFATSRHLVAPHVTGWTDNLRDSHPVRYLAPK